MQPLEGLLFAAVEAKEKNTKQITLLAKSTGGSFRQFRWVGAVRAPGGKFGKVTVQPTVIGLTLVESLQEAIVLRSGKVEYKVRTFQLRGK